MTSTRAPGEGLALTPARRAALLEEVRTADAVERRASRPGRAGGQSLEAFCYRYLPDAFSVPPGEFHRGIYSDLSALVGGRDIEGRRRTGAAFAYPRGHGKTTTVTLGFAAWVLYHWREMPHFQGVPPFILIVSDSLDQARARSLDLRDELEANEDLARDFGPRAPRHEQRSRGAGVKAKGGGRARRSFVKWTETDWSTSDGCRVKAVGAGSKVRGLLRKGRRPTLVVIDDLENDEAVETSEQRKKLERWLIRALLNVGMPGRCLYLTVGTILHADSLLSKALRPDFLPAWLKRRHAACTTPDGTPATPAPAGAGIVPLWPEGWSLEALYEKWLELGSLAFAQEFLNQPVDDENSPFKLEWLERALENGRGVPFAYGALPTIPYDQVLGTWDLRGHELAGTHYQLVVTAWDLALVESESQARERDTDFTVGVTLGLTVDDEVDLRRMYRRRGMTPLEMRTRILAEQTMVEATYVVIENNQAQRIVEWELRQMGIPVVGHQTDRRKRSLFEGVPAMALLFETGRIALCYSTPAERQRLEVLCAELHGLGIEAHDDVVMSLWMALRVINRWIRRRNAERLRLLGAQTSGPTNRGIFPEPRSEKPHGTNARNQGRTADPGDRRRPAERSPG